MRDFNLDGPLELDEPQELELSLNAYQRQATKTAIYGEGNKIGYPILGLVGEAGELANKYKKVLRDDGGVISEEKRRQLADELGDVLWYCAALANDLGENLGNIAAFNIMKLLDRQKRNVISGSGDNR